MGLDWIGLDGWLSYTALTPRASLKSDANNGIIIITMIPSPLPVKPLGESSLDKVEVVQLLLRPLKAELAAPQKLLQDL